VGTTDGRDLAGATRAEIDDAGATEVGARSVTIFYDDIDATGPIDAAAPPPTAPEGVDLPPPASDTFAVSPTDLVALGRVASKAKLARDTLQGRDEAIAEAVTDEGIDVAAVAHAAGMTPAEIATIVFTQEANPSSFVQLRRATRRGQAG
jgi:hypothetical protein